jgi:hypothetical protein
MPQKHSGDPSESFKLPDSYKGAKPKQYIRNGSIDSYGLKSKRNDKNTATKAN